jgi:hypothetical protein
MNKMIPCVALILCEFVLLTNATWVQASETWVTGTVVDERGKTVADAKVYVAATFFGGIRMYETAAVARTDAQGHYNVTGDGDLPNLSGTIVVTKEGMAPAMGWASFGPELPFKIAGQAPKWPPAPVRDFAMTSHGGSLDVVATLNGQPAAGIMVNLRRSGGELRDIWARSSGSPEQEEVEAIAYPSGKTDKTGVAHFKLLMPGEYQITATGDEPPITDWDRRPGSPIFPPKMAARGVAVGVPVVAEKTAVHRMRLYPQPNLASVRVLQEDGKPMSVDDDQLSKRTTTGVGAQTYETPGIHPFESQPRATDNTMDLVTAGTKPYLEANGYVASSELLKVKSPPTFQMRSIIPATLDVQAMGVDGKVLAGRVYASRRLYLHEADAPLDANGHAHFKMLPPGQFVIKLEKSGNPFVVCDTQLPTDQELAGKTTVPAVSVNSAPDEQLTATLKAMPAGYLRGVLKPPPGSKTTDFSIYAQRPNDDPYRVVMQSKTGEFVAGPFTSGPVRMAVWPPDTVYSATVIAGQVVKMNDIAPPGPSKDGQVPSAMIGMGGISMQGAVSRDVSGRVLMPDGKTPAAFARVFYFSADADYPAGDGLTDAKGAIQTHGLWRTNPLPDMPSGAALVATLPGVSGGAVIDLSQPVKGPLVITLPKPISVRGKVTVAGKSPERLNGELRVLAAIQDRGKLAWVLNVLTTPQPDGTFSLAGLTPGHYLVQAVFDGIWLSRSVTLDVGQQDPADISLDIGEPGGPVQIHVIDAFGKPMLGCKVFIDRPRGPLAASAWPAFFRTDGGGNVYIPALEVGEHTVHVQDKTFRVKAPAMPCEKPTLVTCMISAR